MPTKDRYQRNPEACRAANRRSYKRTKERNKQKYRDRAKARKEKIRRLIRSAKQGKACIRCGFNDWRALDFHHREGERKELGVSYMANAGWGKYRILSEIAKCDIICANCHRIGHSPY